MKVKKKPHTLLLYTMDSYDAVGQVSWYCHGIYLSEDDAVMALIAMDPCTFTHAKMVKVDLPGLVLPKDFELLIGEVTND